MSAGAGGPGGRERNLERLLQAALALVALVGLVLGASLYLQERRLAPKRASAYAPLGVVPDFSLTDQGDRPFSEDSLRGKVWVASFIYTRCTTSCPLITAQMVRVQKRWGSNPDFALVSISVDPGHDSPDVLAAYARAMGASTLDWTFLTGPPPAVSGLVEKGFLAMVYPLPVDESGRTVDIPHTTDIRLVDRQGVMRGRFEGILESDWARLDQAIGDLLSER